MAMRSVMTVRAGWGTPAPPAPGWEELGFNHHEAERWRAAGWSEAADAAAWRSASPVDDPMRLRDLRAAGYVPAQLRRTAHQVRRHVAAWTAAIVGPADGGIPLGEARAVAAHAALRRISADGALLDLR